MFHVKKKCFRYDREAACKVAAYAAETPESGEMTNREKGNCEKIMSKR
jgi:hypothetical protein